jgi:glycosyltransferase involved in cell wall biosynthesis
VRTLVVVPTYDEAANIDPLLRRIRHAVPDADVLVVDDSSPDGTADRARALADELGKVEVLQREARTGLGNAYRAGFALGLEREYDAIVQMDADLSHQPEALPALLGALATGTCDLAIGSRYVPHGSIPNWPPHRRALSRYANRYAAAALRLPAADVTSGYRAYRAQILEAIDVTATRATGYAFLIELAYRVAQEGGRIVEVPIVFNDRVRGSSKMSSRIIAEAMWLVTTWGARERLRRSPQRPRPSAASSRASDDA